ncbi:MAG: type II toxin-antitoxin system HicA family toxin [Betaproteobacteria bacterium]|nr:type II toxin-antitoxin system HicA family toxin [Betaproteobacteria bacterium]
MSYRIRLLETDEGWSVSCLDLPGGSQKEAVRVFQKLGYHVVRESGHLIMSNGERRLVIPRHDPIHAITMGAIARDAGLTPQQFRELL